MNIKNHINTMASQCVQCGLCNTHCPTYHVDPQEAESPRGRISLIKALSEGSITETKALHTHLDHCLTCRACEAMCPAGVPYGELITTTRAWLPSKKPHLLARIVSKFRVRKKNLHPAIGKEKGRIALFMGCAQSLMGKATLDSTVNLLTQLGYTVYIPSQYCCGALHLHHGDNKTFTTFIEKNSAAFNVLEIDAIIHCTTGCHSALEKAAFKAPVRDINDFLYTVDGLKTVSFTPLEKRIALHTPCTQRNGLKQAFTTKHLLDKIPGITLLSLQSDNVCCGAAGSYMLEYPKIANKLASPIIDEIINLKADIVCSTNIGCILHLRRQLRKKGAYIAFKHPIELLASSTRRNMTC